MTEPLLTLIPDQLWSVAHTLPIIPGATLPCRMVAARVGPGQLALHSPVPLSDEVAAQLRALGEVVALIAPSTMHHLFMAPCIDHFPEAKVWAAPNLATKRPDLRIDHTLDAETPPWADALTPLLLRGAPRLSEVVFYHRATRSLLVTDLVFNITTPRGLLAPLVFRMFGTLRRAAISKLWMGAVKDREALGESLREVLRWDIDRLIMAHGEVIDQDASATLRRVIGERLPGAW